MRLLNLAFGGWRYFLATEFRILRARISGRWFSMLLLGFIAGTTTSSWAGGEPAGGWRVKPQMVHPEPHAEMVSCYIGTDGALHEWPKFWVYW